MRLCFGRLSVSCLLLATVVLWWKKDASLLVLLNSLDICLIPVIFFSGAKLNVLVANLGALIALTIFLTSSCCNNNCACWFAWFGTFCVFRTWLFSFAPVGCDVVHPYSYATLTNPECPAISLQSDVRSSGCCLHIVCVRYVCHLQTYF